MSDTPKNTPFDGPQLQGEHYHRADMSNTNFDGVNLSEARFYAVLSKAKFNDVNLSEAEFDDANLTAVRFNDVNMTGISITNANMTGITISGVTLVDADIKDADLTGMRINGVLVSALFEAYEKLNAPD
ncbi:pentapeptide repeat-containing protein [Brucella sp. TWI559]